MKTRKRLMSLGLALGLACVTQKGWATGANTDSVTVTISPNANWLVLVSTGAPAGGLSLGQVDALVSTFTVNPTTVTVYSSYATTGLQIEGLLSGGMTLETNSSQLATHTDKLAAWAVFSDTGMSGQPTASLATLPSTNFQGTQAGSSSSTLLTNAFVNVGGSGANKYYTLPKATANNKSMTSLPNYAMDTGASASHLWLALEMSPVATATGQQTLTVVVKGVAAF